VSLSSFRRVHRTGGYSMFRRAFVAPTLFALLLPAGQLFAQGSIAGKVSDERGTPLANAQVLIDGGTKGAVSAGNGEYVITGVPPGPHQVLARFIPLPPPTDPVHPPPVP